jgi:hypothetical protein
LLGGEERLPVATTGEPTLGVQTLEMVRRPLRVEIPRQTFRNALGLEDRRYVAILRDPRRTNEETEAVFYFPGCGSERLRPRAGQKVLTLQSVPPCEVQPTEQRCANAQGFSLHAAVRCAMNQRTKLERLCRYITRPGIANERLQPNRAG